MSIFRAILNNGFFILLLLVIVTLYLAYSDSIKRDHGILSESNTDVAAPHSASNEAGKTTASAEVAPVEVNVEPEQTSSNNAPKSAPSTASDNTAQAPEPDTDPSAEATTETADGTAQTARQAATQPDDTDVLIVTEDIVTSEEDPRELLKAYKSFPEAVQAARHAAEQKDYTQAEKLYFALALVTRDPNMAGELGNILYQDNKPEWAEKAWLEAARMLIMQGQYGQAMQFAQRLAPGMPQAAQTIRNEVQTALQMRQQAPAPANMTPPAAMPNAYGHTAPPMRPMPPMQPMPLPQAYRPNYPAPAFNPE
ncbi:MAG: hypothetical protein ACP5D0_02775 [Hydrogenovibrio sp.]